MVGRVNLFSIPASGLLPTPTARSRTSLLKHDIGLEIYALVVMSKHVDALERLRRPTRVGNGVVNLVHPSCFGGNPFGVAGGRI